MDADLAGSIFKCIFLNENDRILSDSDLTEICFQKSNWQ